MLGNFRLCKAPNLETLKNSDCYCQVRDHQKLNYETQSEATVLEKTQVEQSSSNHVFLMHMALILLHNFANRCGWYYVPVYIILICGQMLSLGLIKHHSVKTYRVGRTYVSKCS